MRWREESESVVEGVNESESQKLARSVSCPLPTNSYKCRERKDDCERINNSFGLEVPRKGY